MTNMTRNGATYNGSSDENYDSARSGSVVYLCIVGACGIIANSLVIFVFWKYPKLRTAANLFILNLAFCDLMLSILDNTFSIASTLDGEWLFGRAGCVSYGFFHYFFICCTVSTLAAISVDRFFFITRPSQTRAVQVITRRRAVGIIAIIYLYSLLFTFPPCVGWNDFVVEKYFFSGCYINYGDQRTSSIVYSVIAPLFLFLVPLIIMVYCYARIFVAVRRSAQRTISRSLGTQSLKRYPLLKRTHIQTAKMIVVVIFFSMIVWVPYVIVSFIKAANRDVNPLVSHITVLVAKSCVIYNVLIYAILNRKLKAAILDAICCGRQSFFLVRSPSSGNSPQKNRISRILSETEVPSHIAEAQKNRLSTFTIQQSNENVHDQYPADISPPRSPKLNGVLKSVEFEDEQGRVKVPLNVSNENIKSESRTGTVGSYADTNARRKELSKIQRPLDENASVPTTNGFLVKPEGKEAENIISHQEANETSQLTPGGISIISASQRNTLRHENTYLEATVDTPLCSLPRDSAGQIRQLNRIHHLCSSRSSKNLLSQNLSSPSQLYKKGVRPTRAQHVTRRSPVSSNPRASSTDPESDLSRRHSREPSREGSFVQLQTPRCENRTNAKYATAPRRKSHSYINYSKKGIVDPLHTTAQELLEIQNYWKRMSLCLDDIDLDEVTREIEMV